MRIEKKIIYFKEPGPKNTDDTIEAVVDRLKEGDINQLVVASDSGETALKLAKAVQGRQRIIVISMKRLDRKFKAELERLGVTILESQVPSFRVESLVCAKRTYYTLGQGFKVAVEVVTMAAAKGVVVLYTDIIGIGGTDTGADTALVVKASKPEDVFGGEIKKRLEVREILAMPLQKTWWD